MSKNEGYTIISTIKVKEWMKLRKNKGFFRKGNYSKQSKCLDAANRKACTAAISVHGVKERTGEDQISTLHTA